MKTENLYINKTPLRALFIFELIVGLILLCVFLILFINEIYLDIWSFAGPLFGLALIITGLTGSKIKEINLNSSAKFIEVKRESLFMSRTKQINSNNLRIELKTANGKKHSLIPKLRIVILDTDREIEELKSGFLSMNNAKIKKLYNSLKSIVKTTNTDKDNGYTRPK